MSTMLWIYLQAKMLLQPKAIQRQVTFCLHSCCWKSFSVELLWESVIPWHLPGMPTFIMILVTNGWWLRKTGQKWENRTLCKWSSLDSKRWWVSEVGTDEANSFQFFSIWIFDYKQQSSLIVVRCKTKLNTISITVLSIRYMKIYPVDWLAH